MMPAKELPDMEELRSVFDYDEIAGLLIWKYRPDRREWWNTRYAGNAAGIRHKRTGVVRITINGVEYLAHRLILKYLTGNDPKEDVSLTLGRCITGPERAHRRINERELPAGVSLRKRRDRQYYSAQIEYQGRRFHLGYYPDPKAAHMAYKEKAKELYGDAK